MSAVLAAGVLVLAVAAWRGAARPRRTRSLLGPVARFEVPV